MTNQDYSSMIEFVGFAENDKGIAIVKVIRNGIGLTLSLEHGRDIEVYLRHAETRRLVNLLEEALHENERRIVQEIDILVKAALPNLPSHLRQWAEEHLITPQQEIFAQKEDGTGEITLWLVTDHTQNHDSASRIVYDEVAKSFGLVMDMQNDVKWFMGSYGSFAKTIDAM